MTELRKAKRGVILTTEGWQKLRKAQQEREKQEKSVKPYTIEVLSEITQLDPSTVSKVLNREVGVDKRTLKRFFNAFNLEFSQDDCQKLQTVSNPIKKTKAYKQNNYFGNEVPDASIFYGRREELDILKRWIIEDNCRLVALIGIGGIGKTTLSAKINKDFGKYFEYSLWFSLRNAPCPIEILTNLLQILSNGEETELGKNINLIIQKIIGYLQDKRCLLIFDNVDAVFIDGSYSGNYLEGYESYGEFFKKIGEISHQSCLLMTSREKPKEVAAIEGKELPIRSLQISHLGIPEIKEIFKVKGIIDAKDSDLKQLIDNYGGNPLYFKVIATTILDLFQGNISDFISQNTIIFGDISDLVRQQFQRLSSLEKCLLYWLAINRYPIDITEFKEDLLLQNLESINELGSINQFNLLEILESLHRRSLIEKTKDHLNNSSKFLLQPVIMEYITIDLINKVCKEILSEEISVLQSHALLKATAPDYIQEIQKRLIILPIIKHLKTTLGSQEKIESYLTNILNLFRAKFHNYTGYVAGNIINLLSNLSLKVSNKDFSNLNILQGNLQGITLNDIDFSNSNFDKTTFTETFGIVFSLAFSPDDKFLVTGGINGEVCLWNWKENKQIFKRKEHKTIVNSVAFSDDYKTIASSSRDQTVKVWDIATAKCIFTFNAPNHYPIKSLVFYSDKNWLLGYSNKSIISWDLDTGTSEILIESESSISCLNISVSTGLLAFGCTNGIIYLWDLNIGKLIDSFQNNSDLILSIKITEDGDILACNLNNQTVSVWSLKNKQCLTTLKSQSYHISLIDISNSGKHIATGSGEKIVKAWDIDTGSYLQSLEGHLSEINAITFSSNNKLATASVDRTIKIWDIRTGKCLKTLQGRADFIHSVVCSKNAQIIVSSSQHTIKFWDLQTHKTISTFFEDKHWFSSLIISSDEKMIACATIGNDNNIIKIWPISSLSKNQVTAMTNQKIYPKILQGHNDSIWSIAFSSDSTKIVSGSSDRTIKIWNSQTGECIATFEGHTRPILSVAFSPDGKKIASCGGHSIIKIWDLATGKCQQTIQENASYIIKFISNDVLASGQTNGLVKLWNIHKGQCIETLGKFGQPVVSMTCSDDGQFLAYGCYNGTIYVWNINNHKSMEILSEQLQFSSAWSLAFSSDSNLLVVGREQEIVQLLDIRTGQIIQSFQGDRPYERMNISGVRGLTSSTITSLQELGAYNS